MPGSDPVKDNRAPRARTRWRRVELARTTLERGARVAARSMVQAAKQGDTKAAKWLLEHVEVLDEQGNPIRPIAPGVDSGARNAQAPSAPEGPRIVIGVALGRDFAQLATDRPADRPALPAIAVSHTVSAD